MAQSLYQKYRPQGFHEVSGQDHITRTLRNELNNESVAHAYLFSGPRGVGKTSSARLLARAVNCTELKDGEPCNTCNNCTLIQNGQALDIIEIDAASHTGVDNVRENIIEHARVASSQLPWKVFIIDEVHMLSTSAFNALLKTLEEPPKKTMFILATTELHKVPETIASRCERFTFHRIPYEQIMERLKKLVAAEEVKVSDDVLSLVARRSEGCLRDAESLLGQVLTLGDEEITMDMVSFIIPRTETGEVLKLWEMIVSGDMKGGVELVGRLVDEGVQMEEFMRTSVDFLRSVMVWMVRQEQSALENIDIDAAGREKVAEIAGRTTVGEVANIVDVLLAASEKLAVAAIPQLPLELAIVELTHKDTAPVQPQQTPPAEEKKTPAAEVAAPQPAQSEPVVEAEPEYVPIEEVAEEAPQEEPTPVPEESTPQETLEQSKEEAPQSAPVAPTGEGVEHITSKWTELLEEMKRQNHALHLTFQVGRLIDSTGNTLRMGFEYQFYSDRLSDARNKPFIDAAFTAVFGQPFVIEVEVGKEHAQQDAPQQNIEQPSQDEVANVWDLANAAFGAEEGAQ